MLSVAAFPSNRGLIPDETDLTDDTAAQEWVKSFEETTRKLNTNDVKIFEVGPTGMLFIGDISLSVFDGYDVILPEVKPGIWRVVSASEGRADLRLSWVSPGPLDLENLPSANSLPSPDSSSQPAADDPLERIGTASIDSGQLGIIDGDMNNAVLEAVGDEQLAAETLADPFSNEFVGEFALIGGYVINANDGSYAVFGRKEDDVFVELAVRDESTERKGEAEDGGED